MTLKEALTKDCFYEETKSGHVYINLNNLPNTKQLIEGAFKAGYNEGWRKGLQNSTINESWQQHKHEFLGK